MNSFTIYQVFNIDIITETISLAISFREKYESISKNNQSKYIG